jgi:hypothetical protein
MNMTQQRQQKKITAFRVVWVKKLLDKYGPMTTLELVRHSKLSRSELRTILTLNPLVFVADRTVETLHKWSVREGADLTPYLQRLSEK